MLEHSVPKSRSLPPLAQELGPTSRSEGEPPQTTSNPTTSEGARGGCDPTHQHWPPGEPHPSGPGPFGGSSPGAPYGTWDVGWEGILYVLENDGMEWNGVECIGME